MTPATKVLDYCVWQVEAWRKNIGMMKAGSVFTSEVRDGGRVDTTQETIEQRQKAVDHPEGLIAEMKAALPQPPPP